MQVIVVKTVAVMQSILYWNTEGPFQILLAVVKIVSLRYVTYCWSKFEVISYISIHDKLQENDQPSIVWAYTAK